ncbi:hypothetical protein [Mucilaginibacter sp.]|jgi:hypothetical protein|uniref:hypothetical protein n=1 Tax=Mucilaginibacter sp. TaxID=1882438 RepID=UPI002CB7CBF8|nr:hypothetical protein [Mucilaginibacter sp.]HTI58577.1 hypothetical protein [Mucilaginibacter sp.]
MNILEIYYYSLLTTGTVLAFLLFKKGKKQFIALAILLAITLVKELITSQLPRENYKLSFLITDIFNLLEYTLFSIYFIISCRNIMLKKWVKLSIPLFIIFGAYTSVFIYQFREVPVLNIDLEGFLLLIIYTHLLYNLEIDDNKSIYMHADFWIAIGVMIFFGGAFVFIGLLPIILEQDSVRALSEYGKILQILNYIFYNSIIIGVIWGIRNKKYLMV